MNVPPLIDRIEGALNGKAHIFQFGGWIALIVLSIVLEKNRV